MAAVVRLTGKDAAVKLAGSTYAKCRRWEARPRMDFAKARAAGDAVMVNVPINQDFEITATFIYDAAEGSGYPVVQFTNLGVSVAFILMLHSSDASTTGFIGGSGYISETPVIAPHDDVIEFSITIIPDGNVLTYDAIPST